jgi:hypothetical protein
MATVKIPLNKFRRYNYNITTTLSGIYTVPIERAAIVIQAQVANITNQDTTVSAYVSTVRNGLFPLVYNLEIPANDARSILSGRLVLQGIDGGSIEHPDAFAIQAAANNRLTLTLSVLETKNTD